MSNSSQENKEQMNETIEEQTTEQTNKNTKVDLSDKNLMCFKAISNFTTELGELFGARQKSLKLYSRLISKTTLSHNSSILRHIEAFREFVLNNRDAISERNSKKLVNGKITYSDNVYINMEEIFRMADSETKNVIWEHILCISAMVDPSSKAKEILKESMAAGKVSGNEADFISNIIEKVETHVKPDSNPMEAMTSIMSSGVLTDLISGMNTGLNDGSLNIGKLMGAVQGMVGKMGGENGKENELMGAMDTMLGSLKSGQGLPTTGLVPNGPMPNGMPNLPNGLAGPDGSQMDLSAMMNMMSSMMSGLNTGTK
jgi:hypothetical protein